MESADGGLGIGKAFGDGPTRRKQLPHRDLPALPKVAHLLVAQQPDAGPGKNLPSMQFNVPAGSRIGPRPDRGSMKGGEMRPAAQQPPQVARQGANVVSAAHDQTQLAFARQIVIQPIRLVQIDPPGGHYPAFRGIGPKDRRRRSWRRADRSCRFPCPIERWRDKPWESRAGSRRAASPAAQESAIAHWQTDRAFRRGIFWAVSGRAHPGPIQYTPT